MARSARSVPEADPAVPEAGRAAAVAGARDGDPEAFRVLYRDIQPRLLRYLRFLVSDDAEDVASETWLQATRDMHGFRGDYDGFRGWITTIARHRAMDHLRRGARRPPLALAPAEELTDLPAADDTAASALERISTDAALRMIAALPPDQAEAVLLRSVMGLDSNRAASVLGKRTGAIRTAACRGLRTLASRLEEPARQPPQPPQPTRPTRPTRRGRNNDAITHPNGTVTEGVTKAGDQTLKDMR